MKTLMIISPAPVEQLEPAIEEAEKLRYRVVFCSHVPYSDELVPVQSRYVIPWFDREEIVRIGQLEKIDGIFCIVDWEAPCVAEAAKILGIPHNPPESLALLNHKITRSDSGNCRKKQMPFTRGFCRQHQRRK